MALDVPGFGPSVLSLPAGDGRFPLLVVAHGAGDKPEWQCEWWSSVLGSSALVLCLRGRAMYPRRADTGYYFSDHYALERELLAALSALQRTHGERISPGKAAFAGFSQGAIMGALVLPAHAERFDRLILVEGGYDDWNVAQAKKLARAGSTRVLFACGQTYCSTRAKRSASWLARGGVASRVELAPRAGHTYAGEVGERVQKALPWVFGGDARWRLPKR